MAGGWRGADPRRDPGPQVPRRQAILEPLGPDDDPLLTLSNFYAREDRATGGIALHMTRLVAAASGWRGDALLYRIALA